MTNYKKTFATPAELEEYTVVSLAMCVIKGALKEYSATAKKYSLKDLYRLVKKSKWYDGILNDCHSLGLNANKILEKIRYCLNENTIWYPVSLFWGNKLHWFEVQTFGTKPFVAHRFVIIPPNEQATSQKGGI